MDRRGKLLSIFLAGLLMLANTACACASVVDSAAGSDPHAHHQMHDGDADSEPIPCPHADCEDCASNLIAASSEPEAAAASFAKLGLDDDVVWIADAPVTRSSPLPPLARAGPTVQRPLWRSETPVSRADRLLR